MLGIKILLKNEWSSKHIGRYIGIKGNCLLTVAILVLVETIK